MIGFAFPWLLAALAGLPALWLLLRVMPPAPRRVRFPALRLLLGLGQHRDTAQRTPWWLLLLRLTLLALVIVGAAGPTLDPPAGGKIGVPLLLVVDDGWAAAHDWNRRQQVLADLTADAVRRQRPVLLLTTAPAADGSPIAVRGPMAAAAARGTVQALEPKPWAADYRAAAAAVAALGHDQVVEAVWLADGIDVSGPDGGHGRALAVALQTLGGGVTVLAGTPGRLLRLEPGQGDRPVLSVTALPVPLDLRLAIRAVDGAGQVLAREEALLPAGQGRVSVPLRLPAELRNRLTRLDIEGEHAAAATILLDGGWKRRKIGLVGGDDSAAAPLLAPYYFVERALAPLADLPRGGLATLLAASPDVLILADQPVAADQAEPTRRWVEGGGVLIRFAGPRLAQTIGGGGVPAPLLPVRLRPGGRALGGTMSWTEPQGLATFAPHSPFAGLAVPAEVKVTAQVLAEPDPGLNDRVWAQLSDGTPLITAERRGRGWVVLIHVTANTAWSNLPLSGLFPDLLLRLTGLGDGAAAAPAGALMASEVLDGFGARHPAGGIVGPLPADRAARHPGPRTPPGLYGPEGGRVAFNLAPHLPDPKPLALPAGVAVRPLDAIQPPRDLSGAVFVAALVLLLADMAVALRLRGVAVAAILAALAAWPTGAARADDGFALRAGLTTRLAFVRTGDGLLDGKSRAGLTTLSRLVGERSTARLDSPLAVDLETDPVLFFPIVYWPLSIEQKPLSAVAVAKLNAYLRSGGLLVLDTQAEGAIAPDPAALRAVTEGLAIPPLAPVSAEHVLTRSFYLLKDLPGRWNGPVWVAESGGDDRDGVSPVVVGGNDWAGAWATDAQGRPSFACVPGGERQRELAFRFGVNLVMYALTGNYKADQVHLPAILERLGQ